MKKLAIVGPGVLPVPAVNGGAVEELITIIIEENETNPSFEIDVYTVSDRKLESIKYKHCTIIEIKRKKLLIFINKFVKKITNREIWIDSYKYAIKRVEWSKYDYILIENTMRLVPLIQLDGKTDTKLYFHLHNHLEGISGDKSTSRANIVAKKVDKIICCSYYLQKKIRNSLEIDNTEVLENCIDLEKFKINGKSEILRERIGIKKDDFIILYSGRIEKSKGVKELIEAVKELMDMYDNIKLLIVGSAWFPNNIHTAYMEELYQTSKGLEDKLIFTGFVPYDMIADIYSISSLVVIPSLAEETFGMVALESLVLGKPMVVTDAGGLTEIIDNNCALIVKRDKNIVNNLRDGILRLYLDPGMMEKMSKACLKRFREVEDFHSENYLNNFQKILGIL